VLGSAGKKAVIVDTTVDIDWGSVVMDVAFSDVTDPLALLTYTVCVIVLPLFVGHSSARRVGTVSELIRQSCVTKMVRGLADMVTRSMLPEVFLLLSLATIVVGCKRVRVLIEIPMGSTILLPLGLTVFVLYNALVPTLVGCCTENGDDEFAAESA